MHYKNGRAAKVGDRVVCKDWQGSPLSGVVIAQNVGSDTCNLTVCPIRQSEQMSLTAKECLHIEDVFPAPLPVAVEAEPLPQSTATA